MSPFEVSWYLLKMGGSPRAQIGYDHLPTEMNYDAVTQFLQSNPNATMGDMMAPYLRGQFTNPSSEVFTDPRSYQSGNLPFPMTEREASSFASKFQTDDGYSIPENYISGGHIAADRPLLMNTIRTLQGRLRQMPDAFEFQPTENRIRPNMTSRPTGKMARLGQRFENYMNTPVAVRQATMIPPTPTASTTPEMLA